MSDNKSGLGPGSAQPSEGVRHFVNAVGFYLAEWESGAMTKREALHHIRHTLSELPAAGP